MTQRTASTRFDLPQPFGPTTPVRPGSISKSVGSTKDLNPMRRSRVSFILWTVHCSCCGSEGSHGKLTPKDFLPFGAGSRHRIGAEINRQDSERNLGRRIIQTLPSS